MLVVGFQIGDQPYALPAADIEQVIPAIEPTTLTQAPAFVYGLINLHGRPIAVIDLNRMTGQPPAPHTLATRIIITNLAPQTPLGLLAHHVTGAYEMDDAQLFDTGLQLPNTPWLKQIKFDPRHGAIRLIDPEHLISDQVKQLLDCHIPDKPT